MQAFRIIIASPLHTHMRSWVYGEEEQIGRARGRTGSRGDGVVYRRACIGAPAKKKKRKAKKAKVVKAAKKAVRKTAKKAKKAAKKTAKKAKKKAKKR